MPANLRIEAWIERVDHARPHREKIRLPNPDQRAVLAHKGDDGVLQPMEIKPAPDRTSAGGFLRQHFHAGGVDEVDPRREQKDVPVTRIVLVDLVQPLLNVIDRSEVYGS